MINILPRDKCPPWVEYPNSFLELSTNNQDFYPWYILPENKVEFWMEYLKKTYNRDLFPFARKDLTDDFACWEKNNQSKIFIIHTFTSLGWEQREIFDSFDDWYKWALEQREAC